MIDLQSRRRELEVLTMKETVSRKNTALTLDWLEGRRIEQEARELEAKIIAEEAAEKKRLADAKKKKKGKKGDAPDAGEDAKAATKKKKADKEKEKEKEKQLTPEKVQVC